MLDLFKTAFYTKNGFSEVRRIERGNSGAVKFYVKTDKDKEYLAKVSETAKPSLMKNRLKSRAERAKQVADAGVPISQLRGAEKVEGKVVHFYSWCDGENLSKTVKSGKYDESQVYRFGFTAGEFLRVIHTLPAENKPDFVYNRISEALATAAEDYCKRGVTIPVLSAIISFLTSKDLDFLRQRKPTITHGDYHVGNIMYSEKSGYAIIDYTFSLGEPMSELAYVYSSAKYGGLLYEYANGQIDGYLARMQADGHGIPLEDFRRDFMFFFALKMLTRGCHMIRKREPTERLIRQVTNYTMNALRWINARYGVEEYNLPAEIVDALAEAENQVKS
jgi:aminoglycoside phosphotransferase (APT) family kinase protein